MYKKIAAIITILQSRLHTFQLHLNKKVNPTKKENNFSSLSPIGNADQDGHYGNALEWALSTRDVNDIRNIAITGPYGSGKSSVLKTFRANCNSKELHFLSISLATFKEESIDNELQNKGLEFTDQIKENHPDGTQEQSPIERKKKTNTTELIRLIELSILQQIFYHADDNEIPDSRFKKIKRINQKSTKLAVIGAIAFIINLLFLSRENLPEVVLNIIKAIEFEYMLSIAVLYLMLTSYVLFFYVTKTKKTSWNTKLPNLLIGVNLITILYVAFNFQARWATYPVALLTSFITLKTVEAMSFAYLFIFTLVSLYHLLSYISKISVNKLKFQNAEIEIDSKISKSILNHHLDEILYFFEVTAYNVVIIEDLDRFQQTEIFTKLREINLLLNNSKKTKSKQIVFIYAVRDEMFTDKERSKFFDFIIPIIPVINSTNSGQKLLEKNAINKYGWTEDLIESISIYVDDMRLLHNVCNEFTIYFNKLPKTLTSNKLLAMLVYKNLYPNDFSKLNQNEGKLYDTINSREIYIKREINKLQEDAKILSKDLKTLEALKIKDVNELRLLYISRYVGKISEFNSFSVNQTEISINEMTEEENFNYLMEDSALYSFFFYSHNNYYNLLPDRAIPFKFKDIESEVDPTKSYSDRVKDINDWHSQKANALREKIQKLEIKQVSVRKSKLKDVFTLKKTDDRRSKNHPHDSLIESLLSNGYIDESYHDFMTIFYEGSLTKVDNDFLINLRNQKVSDFTQKLVKLDALLKRIGPYDFEQAYVLNNSLVTHVLKNENNYQTEVESIFNKLKDESETSVQFIHNYIDLGEELEIFINKLCSEWDRAWHFIETADNIPDERKVIYFKKILAFSNPKDIAVLAKNSSLKKKIEGNKEFLNIIPNADQLKKIIEELSIEFSDLNFETSPADLLEFIYENRYYKINAGNLTNFIKRYGEFNQHNFDSSNYSAIVNSNCKELVDYVDDNITTYVTEVYLQLKSNVDENEKYLIDLLNHDELSIKNKDRIIVHTNMLITQLSLVSKSSIYTTLFEQNKLVANWNNVLYGFFALCPDQDNSVVDKLPPAIIKFLNIEDNSIELSKTKTTTDDKTKKQYTRLWKTILHTSEIADLQFSKIVQSCPWWFNNLDFANISREKLTILIDRFCVMPDEKSFMQLKECEDGLNIRLLEKNQKAMLEILDKLEFDSADLYLVLNSTFLSLADKMKILNICEDEVIFDWNNLKTISKLLLVQNPIKINDEILEKLLLEPQVDGLERITHFTRNHDKYDYDFIEQFVNALPNPFKKINDKTIKAKVPKTELNSNFLTILSDSQYISSFSDNVLDSFYRVNHKRK